MDTDHLRRLFDAGRSFREAFDEACHADTAYAVEAFELWTDWEAEHPVPLRPHPIGASKDAVCWLLRDEWAGLPPGTWCRDGRSTWLVPNTQTVENAR